MRINNIDATVHATVTPRKPFRASQPPNNGVFGPVMGEASPPAIVSDSNATPRHGVSPYRGRGVATVASGRANPAVRVRP